MRRTVSFAVFLSALVAGFAFMGGAAAQNRPPAGKDLPLLSGAADLKDIQLGIGITECPQAGQNGDPKHPQPLDKRTKDKAEQVSETGDERRMDVEYSCFPQDETAIDVNPLVPRNAVGGANDYRLGWGQSGFFATTNNGQSWYSGLTPAPSVPGDDHIDGGGDPVTVFDSEGVVYYSQIRFERETDRNGIFVNRSTNGGFTWSRPCVPVSGTGEPTDETGVCGGAGGQFFRESKPGDGVVTYNEDPDREANFSVPFDDKEFMASGPRPAGVEPVCFAPVSRTPVPCDPETVGAHRIYVTWTRFAPGGLFGFTARIMISFSDDQARSWSPARSISASAPFCAFSATAECDLNQFSVPTVHPTTGLLGVAFENFNTPEVNQYLFVRSRDGGVTFEGPFFVTPVFDVNYPNVGRNRQDCAARGQGNRDVLTNSCFRVNAGGNVVVDRRSGGFADDFYLVMSDNRNGTPVSSNTDTFFFKSTDGGSTWIGPTRVNDDPSEQPEDRQCDEPTDLACAPTGGFGNDQWFPWTDISDRGDVNVNFYDRRLDPDSVAHEYPTSRQRPGNYLLWRFGGVCRVTSTATVTEDSTTIPSAARECLAPTAEIIPQPEAPITEPGPFREQTVFPFRNFSVSDVPNNWDYCFRGGIFCGDYDLVAIGSDGSAWAVWTDARNGRSSRLQTGRNPGCDQSDAWFDLYGSASGGNIGQAGSQYNELFLVTPCPSDIRDPGSTSP